MQISQKKIVKTTNELLDDFSRKGVCPDDRKTKEDEEKKGKKGKIEKSKEKRKKEKKKRENRRKKK